MSGADDVAARARAIDAARAAGGGGSGQDLVAGEMPDDPSILERCAAGNGSVEDDLTYASMFAGEVLLLRARVDRIEAELVGAREARDDAADAFDVLVRRVWEAATGDTHEGPANVEVLVEAVAGLRARAERAGAELDALRVAVQEYLRVGSTASYKALAERVGLTVREG